MTHDEYEAELRASRARAATLLRECQAKYDAWLEGRGEAAPEGAGQARRRRSAVVVGRRVPCVAEGCGRSALHRGLCSACYHQQWRAARRSADPPQARPRPTATPRAGRAA